MSNSFHLEIEVHKLIKFGYDQKSIVRALDEKHDDKVFLEEVVDRACEAYPDFELIQFFMDSKVVVDKDGEDNQLYLFNERKQRVLTIDKSRLLSILNPKLDWSSRRYTCRFTYDPYKPYKLKKFKGEWCFNLYEPPFWAEEYFRSGGKLRFPSVNSMPDIYNKFFNHLFDADKESLTYVLDWLANMLQSRNYCILTTIGAHGIGS